MTCSSRSAFLAGQLDQPRREAFLAHATSCEACTQALARHASIDASVRAWATVAPPSAFAGAALVAKAKARQRHRRLGVGLAVTALLVMGVVGSVLRDPAARELELSAAGPVSVGDDVVTLEADSTARVRETPTLTVVELKSGRASFQVSKRSGGRRFIVSTRELEVRVVGTRFSVDARANTVEVSEGVVEVFRGGALVGTLHAGKRWPEAVEVPAVVEPVDAGTRPTAPVRLRFDYDAVTRLLATGQLDEAASSLNTELKRQPGDARAWALLGDVRRKQQRPGDAVAAYEQATRSPDAELRNRSRLLAASLLQDALNDQAHARTLLEAGTSDGRCPPSLAAPMLVRLARAQLAAGQRPTAMKTLELVMKRHPESPSAVEARELSRTLEGSDSAR